MNPLSIVLCTTPIRPVPTIYPPFGSLAVIHSLRRAGFDPDFYDIDTMRPTWPEVEEFFRDRQPEVVAISAVVSTAYGYVKRLAGVIRRVSPRSRLILGGNLAASAEILHRLAGIDVCVIGEGETVAANLMKALERSRGQLDGGLLAAIRGITFLRADGEMEFTGYETALLPSEMLDYDFTVLERSSRIENFILNPLTRPDFAADPRTRQPHRRGRKMTTLVTAKGCVSRCTFCHRWDKGYRVIPVERIMAQIRLLRERYDVGFIMFSDENFGSDQRHTAEFLRRIREFDVLWNVGGVRARSMNPELLRRMKDAGCVSVFYGMETGSPAILEVMEKRMTLQDNINAARWTREAGLFTIYQMVLAMPGETDQTILETTDFLKAVTQDARESPRSLISLNYIQALPGTPVYEYARAESLIGRGLHDEERYLLSISDVDAEDDTKFINFTSSDRLTVRSWRRRIVLEVMRHYHQYHRTPVPNPFSLLSLLVKKKLLKKTSHASADQEELRRSAVEEYRQSGYFNLARDLGYDVIVAYFYPWRRLILAVWLLQDELRRLPLSDFARDCFDWLRHRVRRSSAGTEEAGSLRQTLARLKTAPVTPTERSMQPLREGR